MFLSLIKLNYSHYFSYYYVMPSFYFLSHNPTLPQPTSTYTYDVTYHITIPPLFLIPNFLPDLSEHKFCLTLKVTGHTIHSYPPTSLPNPPFLSSLSSPSHSLLFPFPQPYTYPLWRHNKKQLLWQHKGIILIFITT